MKWVTAIHGQQANRQAAPFTVAISTQDEETTGKELREHDKSR